MKVSAVEDPDWGGARTRQAVLISGKTCWSQSTFPCKLGSWHWLPNRDYPYQGLTHVLENGENWKFLDGLGIGIEGLELVPKDVTVTPERVEYDYALASFPSDGPVLSTAFSIDSSNASGVLTISASERLGGPHNLSIMPVMDIRHMYAPSRPFSHRAGSAKSAILAELGGKIVAVKRMNGPAVSITAGHVFDWHYKLGSGFRMQAHDGIRFCGENRSVFVPGTLVFPINAGESCEVRVLFGDSKGEAPLQQYVGNELPALSQIEGIVNTGSSITEAEREALIGRVFGSSRMLASFGRSATLMPYAGEWWFKTVWFRDAYEGLLNNIQTYHLLGLDDVIENAVLAGLSLQNESGRIPTKLPENDTLAGLNYESADSALLCINLGLQYARLSGKKNVMTMSVFCLERLIESFARNNGKDDAGKEIENGPPILSMETGLISCVPWQSWTDSRPYGIPARVPLRWAADFGASELSKPKYLLPEINAQFIRALHVAVNDCDRILITSARRKALEELFKTACASFRRTFWNDKTKFMNNVVRMGDESGGVVAVSDDTFGSPAIVSATLLEGILFNKEELNLILESAATTILARRTPVLFGTDKEKESAIPFGLLVRDSYERGGAYFGDEQYHARVIWPRDNPYLAGLARLCGRGDIARGVLLNTLDHQQSEGAAFYTQELFSLAEGQNPAVQSKHSGNPVPVKNPVQYWSQFCDAFIDGYDFWTRQKKWIEAPAFTL